MMKVKIKYTTVHTLGETNFETEWSQESNHIEMSDLKMDHYMKHIVVWNSDDEEQERVNEMTYGTEIKQIKSITIEMEELKL